MGSKNYPEAISLYTKGVEVCPTADNSQLAILYANRSLAHLNMNLVDAASKDADLAIASDSTYLKAHFRKVVALIAMQDYQSAREIICQCLTLQPADADFQKQLSIVEAKIAGASNVAKPLLVLPATKAAASTASASSDTIPATSATTRAAAREEEDVEPSDNLRGSKLTSDGRKTTFFNNELDDKTKALIGNIAPKKLDPSSSSNSTSAPLVTGASAWNTAGTFESVDHCTSSPPPASYVFLKSYFCFASDHTYLLNVFLFNGVQFFTAVWARARLKLLMDGISDTSDAGDGFHSVVIKDTAKVEGDAQTTMNRGKRKVICDFTIEIEWVATSTDGTKLEGQLTVNDVTADKEYEFCCSYPKVDIQQKHALEKRIKILQATIASALESFFDELNAK